MVRDSFEELPSEAEINITPIHTENHGESTRNKSRNERFAWKRDDGRKLESKTYVIPAQAGNHVKSLIF